MILDSFTSTTSLMSRCLENNSNPTENKTIVICANSAFAGCFLKQDSHESDDSDASGESGDFGESVFFF